MLINKNKSWLKTAMAIAEAHAGVTSIMVMAGFNFVHKSSTSEIKMLV